MEVKVPRVNVSGIHLNSEYLVEIPLSPDISCFENSVNPDQLTSVKPADQDSHVVSFCL